jgi:cobyrinic acid a,c-diamide synthase
MLKINVPRLYISAIKKSSGKTTLSIALSSILSKKYKLLTFKKGPDYIDPMWLESASRNYCYNLDFFFLKDKIYTYFVNKVNQNKCDFCLIEGNHGLFDDIYADGRTSNASLAKITKTPVILVIDVSEFGRSIAPLLLGFINFDKDVLIAGVVLNKVQSSRQEKKLIEAIKKFVNIPILGVLPQQDESITQRHLGLSSTLKLEQKQELIDKIAYELEKHIDVSEIIKIAKTAPDLYANKYVASTKKLNKKITIAVAFDEAFNFYYNQNLEILKSLGVEIKRFSPLFDEELPNADAIYIGGGFPELFLGQLEKNFKLRSQIKKASEEGMLIYAECGGLMYLTNNIIYNDSISKMCSVFNLNTYLSKKPMGHGYTVLSAKNRGSFLDGKKIYAHEFHHGFFKEFSGIDCFFNIERGYGINGICDGATINRTLANFSHIFDYDNDFFYNWFKSNGLDY